MTAPYSIQQLSVPNVAPSGFIPAPTGAEQFYKAAGDLAAVLHAARALSQQSQLQNRELDVRRELGLGNIGVQQAQVGVQQAENQRLLDEQRYKQQQAQQAQLQAAQTGRGVRTLLQAHGVQGLDGIPDAALAGMAPDLERMGIVGPLTTNARDFAKLQNMDPTLASGTTAGAAAFRQLIMPRAPTTNIYNQLGNQFGGPFMEGIAKDVVASVGDAQKTLGGLSNIATAHRMIPKIITGSGANARLAIAKGLSLLGSRASGDLAADTETYKRLTQDITLAFLKNRDTGSGTAVSDRDLLFIQGLSGEDISKQPDALQRTLRVNYGVALMKAQSDIETTRQAALDQQAIGNTPVAKMLTRRVDYLQKQAEGRWNEYMGLLLQEKSPDTAEHVQGLLAQLQAQYPGASWLTRLEQRVRQQDAQDAQAVRRALRGK